MFPDHHNTGIIPKIYTSQSGITAPPNVTFIFAAQKSTASLLPIGVKNDEKEIILFSPYQYVLVNLYLR